MPNHITNIVSFNDIPYEKIKEILEAIKNDEFGVGSIDFNKIIPMPDNIFRGNLGTEEREKYGQNNWYDWSISNWGSKWNSYEFIQYEEGRNSIEFHTAWSTVPQVIKALSEKFPDAIVKVQWSDEDFAYNVGEREYQNGEIISENIPFGGSKEAYELAAEIRGYDLEDLGYRLSADGRSYEDATDIEETIRIEEKMKVVLVKPMQAPVITEIGSDLKSMQDSVGGRIEEIMPFEEEVALVCNEEGKNLQLQLNRAIKFNDGEIMDIIAGSFFICAINGENFTSLSDDQLSRYSDMFKNPECFCKINGEIKAIPIAANKGKENER